MGQVAVDINGRRFQVACDDGQEDHVRELGAYIDGKVKQVVNQVGQVGDPRLLLMASLLVTDELYELRQGGTGQGDGAGMVGGASAIEERAAQMIEGTADRLHDIAARLEAS
ncbi:cell division protein ZapA [Rhodovibrio salinarum]|uniref:Cell division protein ZapA n=1 Tax=Rhodovibrio salinarum TaxID=1087 RepID=A0A934QHV0_9PROT|nr:cell division protein ZapA [Rhodovibrio salinarum]MBK1697313.1 cell division protein ZapA [Rhodovibrio salinarum]